jgi:hypothetical protein
MLLLSLVALAQTCDPTIDPNGNFLSNFAKPNSCYTIPIPHGTGGNLSGDLNAVYNVAYFQRNTNYELIIIGMFPNARYFGLAGYDDHWVSRSSLDDVNMVPLLNSMHNPYVQGSAYRTNQKYAAVLSFGGSEPTQIAPGCGYNGINLRSNIMTVTDRHSVPTWTGYPGLPRFFPPHQTGPSAAGAVMVRAYLPSPDSTGTLTPILIVRDLTTGCAVTADDAINNLQLIDVSGASLLQKWMQADQINYHYYFQNTVVGRSCYGIDPLTKILWFRGGQFSPGDNPAGTYSNGQLPSTLISQLRTGSNSPFLRVRFKAPDTPNYPCAGCLFDDTQDLRYWSLSFTSNGTTYQSIPDTNFVKDAGGYVSLIIRLNPSTTVPPRVTAANGYTYVDFSGIAGIDALSAISLRQLRPSQNYLVCAAVQIPYEASEYNDQGGWMGEYVPTIDFPVGAALPAVADHVNRPNSCGLQPITGPGSCTP